MSVVKLVYPIPFLNSAFLSTVVTSSTLPSAGATIPVFGIFLSGSLLK